MKRIALTAAIVLALASAALIVYRIDYFRNLAYDFALTDQDGRTFRLSQDRGHVTALFFGYTNCTDTCPAVMEHLARARADLMRTGTDVRIVFVTVDPSHDTPARMKSWLAKFDPSFVGLTGSEAQLAPVYRAYHIWYQALPKSKQGLEEVEAHTATITIVDSGGRIKGYADESDSVASLARGLRAAAT